MNSAKEFIGTDVYCQGKIIGRITDLFMDVKNKSIKGISAVSNTGIIRTRFYVPQKGISKLCKEATIVEKDEIQFKKDFGEEFSVFDLSVSKNSDFGHNTLGDVFIDSENKKILSISIKNSFIDDLIFGREVVDIDSIKLKNNGQIFVFENRR